MKRKIIFLFVLALILLVGFLVLLQNIKISGVIDVKSVKDNSVHGGLNQTCSTPTFRIDCRAGLTCATADYISDFDPRYAIAKCRKTSLIKDLDSNIWHNKK